MTVSPLHVVAHILAPDVPPEDWAEGDFHYSESPKPCFCGNKELRVVETIPTTGRCLRRVAVHCPKCGAIGQDTVHHKVHAIRRWNWHGDQRHTELAEIIQFQPAIS